MDEENIATTQPQMVEQTVIIEEPSASSPTPKKTRKKPTKRKAPAKKKTTSKKPPSKKNKEEEKKEEIVYPEIPGISSIRVKSEIINALKETKRIRALQLYRIATSTNLGDAVQIIDEYWGEIQLMSIDLSSYPAKSCMNCIGACGKLKKIVQEHGVKLWDVRRGVAAGSSCSSFISEDTLKEQCSGKFTIRFADTLGRTRNQAFIQIYDGKIMKSKGPRERKENLEILKKGYEKDFIQKVKLFLNDGFQVASREKLCTDIRYKGIDPKVDEKWSDYEKRVNNEIKQIRIETQNQYLEMPEEEVSKYLEENFKANGLGSILEGYGNDIGAMCRDFFPDKTLQEIASSTATHLMV